MIRSEVPSIRTDADAEAALARVKEKVEGLIADARRPEESNGHRREAPVIDPDVPQRERGVMLDRVPMPTRPRRTGPKRKRGETLRAALRVLADEGPMKQSDLRRRIGIQAPEMANLKKKLLDAGVREGALVDKSPMLHYDGPAPESPSEGAELQEEPSELQSATETPPPIPPPQVSGGDLPAPSAPAAAPPVNDELAEYARRVRDAVAELTAATDALLARLGER